MADPPGIRHHNCFNHGVKLTVQGTIDFGFGFLLAIGSQCGEDCEK
jgi:hypothetical protein